ncbi:multidrug MFS transporter [Mycobacterium sherrisii]|uniref:Multidrug MFS transporter n=1 Tax=Mycobacterium sherrisii TaxID=243061 RepID=A0A1E3SF16_9MYCO|nr:multidrug MFS transporter [Mycobacterium sherrisii]
MSAPVSIPAVGRAGTAGVLAAMCLSLVLVVASVSALNLALPDLAVDLDASNTALTWIADAYTVALAALVLPFGAIGDRWGRRNVLIVGNVVFGAASMAAALTAQTTTELIIWRAVMGIAAAMIMPGTLSTITAAFPTQQRARGVAAWSGFAAAGAIVGLLAAGALLEVWTWRSIFLTSAVVAAVSVGAAAVLAPNTADTQPPTPDLAGAITTALGIGTVVFAIIEGNDRGWTTPIVMTAVVVSVLSFTAYAAVGFRKNQPLLDPRLFGVPGFRAGAVTILVQFMAIFGFFFVGLQYLQLILAYSPLTSAVALVPVAVVVVPASLVTPRIVGGIGLKAVMAIGLIMLGAGLFSISRLTVDSGYWPFLAGLIICGIGIGMLSSAATAAIVGSLNSDKQGVASAVNDTTREIGSAVGIALTGSIFSSHYRSGLPPTVNTLPLGAAETVRHSAAGGLAVAGHLGPGGVALADAVDHAFIDGLSASLVVITVILLVAALGCLLRAPHRLPDATVHALDKTPDADQTMRAPH